MENLKNKTIISKQVNLCDTRERDNFRLYWKDGRKMNFVPIHRLQKLECTRTGRQVESGEEKKRLRHEKNWTLGNNGQGPMTGPLKKSADHPTCREESKESRGRNRSNGNGKESTSTPSWSPQAPSLTVWQGSFTWRDSQQLEKPEFFVVYTVSLANNGDSLREV